MDQLSPPQPIVKNVRHYIEGTLAILRMTRRSWRLIAVAVVACVAAAAIYATRGQTAYLSTARLLVLQQAGRWFGVAGGDPFQHLQEQDSLATHMLIIRSPAIVERAIALAGLGSLPVDAALQRLTVKQPTDGAKVIELTYRTDGADEALAMMRGIIASYNQFLKENYQKDTREVIALIVKARDDLSNELRQLEREYLEFRQKSPTFLADKEGRTFLSRRVDQWDQASNQALSRSLQIQSQLELARKLSGEGAEPRLVAAAINQIAGGGAVPIVPDGASREVAAPRSPALQLAEVRRERRGLELLVKQIKEQTTAAARPLDDPAVIGAFHADPAVAQVTTQIHEMEQRHAAATRIAVNPGDPAVQNSLARIRALKTRLAALWQEKGPLIAARRDAGHPDPARRYEDELIVLRAREATLAEQAREFRENLLAQLRAERDGLAGQGAKQAAKLAEVDRRIAATQQEEPGEGATAGDRRNAELIATLEQSARAIEAMRGQIQQMFGADLDANKQAEIAQLAEANLRSNLDRQRTLFDSVASQLKQAQLTSDFGSTTAQTINPPGVVPIQPRVASVLLLGLVAGCGLGGGLAYLVDLMEGRVRTVSELKSALNLPLIAAVPRLPAGGLAEAAHLALASHQSPRSFLAESYKTARTNIEFLRRNRRAQVILVSSPKPGNGKSTTSSNLAITLALAGRRVLLVDGDLRKPCLHQVYGLSCRRGLVTVLQGEATFGQVVQPTAIENLDLLAAGPETPNPAELLASDLLAGMIDEVRPRYDAIIFDTSPFLSVTDPWIISAVTDGILLVIRLGSTRQQDIEQTMEVLHTLNAPILGTIANGVTRENQGYGYGYGYGYVRDLAPEGDAPMEAARAS